MTRNVFSSKQIVRVDKTMSVRFESVTVSALNVQNAKRATYNIAFTRLRSSAAPGKEFHNRKINVEQWQGQRQADANVKERFGSHGYSVSSSSSNTREPLLSSTQDEMKGERLASFFVTPSKPR